MQRRIHITGASGSGTTSLGAALAERLSVPHFDTDDFYWYPSLPEFERKRPVKERLRLMRAAVLGEPGWVLSGSLPEKSVGISSLLRRRHRVAAGG